MKRPKMKSHKILQIQGSVLICLCVSCMFCTGKLITNCPKLLLGLYVSYGEKTLGVPGHCQPPEHSSYLSKGVRAHLRPNGFYIYLPDVTPPSPCHYFPPISLAMVSLLEFVSLLLLEMIHYLPHLYRFPHLSTCPSYFPVLVTTS